MSCEKCGSEIHRVWYRSVLQCTKCMVKFRPVYDNEKNKNSANYLMLLSLFVFLVANRFIFDWLRSYSVVLGFMATLALGVLLLWFGLTFIKEKSVITGYKILEGNELKIFLQDRVFIYILLFVIAVLATFLAIY